MSRMSERDDEAIAFIDANLCLEFPYGDHTVWAKMTNAKKARVVICRGVLVEVEEKKIDDRLRDASKWWVSKVAEVRKNDGKPIELHKTATLEYYKSPTFKSPAEARGDEAILIQATEFRQQNEGVPFYFITDDGGAKLFAEDEGLNALAPLDFDFMKKARVEKTADQIELEELRQFADQQPKIRLIITGGDDGAKLVNKGTLNFKLYKPKPDHFMQQIRQHMSIQPGLFKHDLNLMREKHENFDRASNWAVREQMVQDESARTVSIKIKLRNDGGKMSDRASLHATYDPQMLMGATGGVDIGGERTHPEQFPIDVVPTCTEDNIPLGKRIVTPLWKIDPAVVVPSNLCVCHAGTSVPGKPQVNPLGVIKFSVDNLGHHGEESEEFGLTFTYKSWDFLQPLKIKLTLRSDNPTFIDPRPETKRENVLTLVPVRVNPLGNPLTLSEQLGEPLGE